MLEPHINPGHFCKSGIKRRGLFTQTPGVWGWGYSGRKSKGVAEFFLTPDSGNRGHGALSSPALCHGNLRAARRVPVRLRVGAMPDIALLNVVMIPTVRGRDSRRCQHCGVPLAASRRLNAMPVGKPARRGSGIPKRKAHHAREHGTHRLSGYRVLEIDEHFKKQSNALLAQELDSIPRRPIDVTRALVQRAGFWLESCIE